jgi:hypothetical protein
MNAVMSSFSKRQASSPAEKVPENKKPVTEDKAPMPGVPKKPQAVDPTSGSLIKFEVVKINDASFYGTLSEVEIIYIWEKILGRSKDEIYGMSYNRSLTRNFRATFKLNAQVETANIYPEQAFEYHRPKPGSDEEFDVLTCKFVGYSNIKPVEIGQVTRVTVKTNDFSVTPSQIRAWLSKFGTVSPIFDFERNSVGVRTDIFETEIKLAKHIPEYLPIAGRKVLVSYPGIPKACNNCYETGHLKRNCKQKKRDWLDRVRELKDSGDFEDELFGGWISILSQRS